MFIFLDPLVGMTPRPGVILLGGEEEGGLSVELVVYDISKTVCEPLNYSSKILVFLKTFLLYSDKVTRGKFRTPSPV